MITDTTRCIVVFMGRTNIEIDDELIARVMRQNALPTKKAAVDFALRRVVIEPMTLEEALAMKGTGWHADREEWSHPRDWMVE